MNEPMVGCNPVFFRYAPHQLPLRLVRRCRGSQSDPIRNPEHVRVYCDRRYIKDIAEHDVRSFSTYSG